MRPQTDVLNRGKTRKTTRRGFVSGNRPETPDEFTARYPRITAHIIAESLGYATPESAARIGLDGLYERENCCEYIYSCYDRNARACLQRAI